MTAGVINKHEQALDTDDIKDAFMPVAVNIDMIVAAGVTSRSKSCRARNFGGLIIVTVEVVDGRVVV